MPELSNFVLTLTQAVALGMPVVRLPTITADEMRRKRPRWARARAATPLVEGLHPRARSTLPAILNGRPGRAVSAIDRAFG